MDRKVKRLDLEGWTEINFMDLRVGDIFRLFDDGPNPYEDGSRIWNALDNPYIGEEAVIGTIQPVPNA